MKHEAGRAEAVVPAGASRGHQTGLNILNRVMGLPLAAVVVQCVVAKAAEVVPQIMKVVG